MRYGFIINQKRRNEENRQRNYTCPVHLDVSNDRGKCPQCGKKIYLSKEQMKAETVKLYTCPMHPDVALDKAGKCPKCGSEMVEKKKSK